MSDDRPTTRDAIRSVAWFASAPPAEDSVAQLTRQVLPRLAEQVDVHLFATTEVDPELERWATIHPALDNLDLWASVHACDIAIFHLDHTAKIHGDIFDLSCQHPGLVVLHEASLHELVAWSWALYQDQADRYLAAVESEHGRAARADAERWLRGELPFDCIVLRYPFTPWIARRALGVLALDDTTHERLTPSVERGEIGPLAVAEVDLPADEWVERCLDVAAEARSRRVDAAVRAFSAEAVNRWSWLPRRLRRRPIDRIAVDLAELLRRADHDRR